MPGRSADAQLGPVAALLPDHHRELDPAGRGDGDAAGLGDHVIGGDRVGLVLDQV